MVTLTGNVTGLAGDLDVARVIVWLEANVAAVIDGTGNEVRLGAERATPDSTGAFTFADLLATNGATNPTSFQYRVRVDYPDAAAGGRSGTWDSGWFALTANADLADVAAGEYVPPTYLTTLMTQLDTHAGTLETQLDAYATSIEGDLSAAVTQAEAAAALAVDISNIGTPDALVAVLVEDDVTPSATRTALTATFARPGDGQTATDTTGARVVAVNALAPLTIPTYDGSGQLVHPHVLFVPEGFGGYQWWMAMTPYPSTNDQYENPSILCSTDGLTWTVPAGLTNPLIGPPATAGAFNSDPCLVVVGGVMFCFYRTVDGAFSGAEERISYFTSLDGSTWSGPTVTLTHDGNDALVSPAVLHNGATGLWEMWGVRPGYSPNKIVRLTATSPNGPWVGEQDCTVETGAGLEAWHIDIKNVGGEYVLITYESPGGAGAAGGALRRSVSREGLYWYPDVRPIMHSIPGAWDAEFYKTTFVPARVNGRDVYRLWYGGYSGGVWRVGHAVASIEDDAPDAQIMRTAALGLDGYRIADTFNRADESDGDVSPMTTGQTWSITSGSAGIMSGRLYVPGGGLLSMKVDSGSNDHDVSMALYNPPQTNATHQGTIYARYADGNNYLALSATGHADGGQLMLYKVVAGAATYHSFRDLQLSQNDRIRLRVQGTAVECYAAGQLVYRTTVTGLTASNFVGLAINQDRQADDFACKPL